MTLLKIVPTLYAPEAAARIAREMAAGDDEEGWTYTSEPAGEAGELAKVAVRDETGALLGYVGA